MKYRGKSYSICGHFVGPHIFYKYLCEEGLICCSSISESVALFRSFWKFGNTPDGHHFQQAAFNDKVFTAVHLYDAIIGKQTKQNKKETKMSNYKVTKEMVEEQVVDKTFTLLPSGKKMICELTLKNGFTVTGEAGVVDKENFVQEVGERISYQRALDNVWPLLGYEMQSKLHEDLNKQA